MQCGAQAQADPGQSQDMTPTAAVPQAEPAPAALLLSIPACASLAGGDLALDAM
jgi:hypothetical protein